MRFSDQSMVDELMIEDGSGIEMAQRLVIYMREPQGTLSKASYFDC